VADPVEEHESPTERSRCDAQRGERVPGIVLAVPERTLTVFPGFPPVHRREAHEKGILGERRAEVAPRFRVEGRTPFERVLLGRVVVHRGRGADPLDGGQDRIALGRMEIPA
jgi:hypothetical protein